MRDPLDDALLPTNPTREELNAYRQRAMARLNRAISLNDKASLADSINNICDFAIVRSRFIDTEPAESTPGVITKADLNDLMQRMNYNRTDCGELGVFVRLEHAANFIEELKGKLDA